MGQITHSSKSLDSHYFNMCVLEETAGAWSMTSTVMQKPLPSLGRMAATKLQELKLLPCMAQTKCGDP